MALRVKKPTNTDNEDKVIEISAQMQGSLNFKDPVNLKINGDFSGDLDTKGTLTIGENANVTANINGDNVIIAGKVIGDIKASKMLVLMPTANLQGDVETPKLNIVEGAIFQGHCNMTGETKSFYSEKLLNVSEVADYLEINTNEIEELANSGQIPGKKDGNAWKFERDQIENWAASGKVK